MSEETGRCYFCGSPCNGNIKKFAGHHHFAGINNPDEPWTILLCMKCHRNHHVKMRRELIIDKDFYERVRKLITKTQRKRIEDYFGIYTGIPLGYKTLAKKYKITMTALNVSLNTGLGVYKKYIILNERRRKANKEIGFNGFPII